MTEKSNPHKNIEDNNNETKEQKKNSEDQPLSRVYSLDDVRQFQDFCRYCESFRKDIALHDSLYYDRLVGAERKLKVESQKDIPQKDYGELMLTIFNGWKNNLRNVKPDNIPKIRGVPQWLEYIQKFRDIKSLDELRILYREHPDVNTLSPASYQDGAGEEGEVNSGFVHFDMSKFYGYVYKRPASEYRIYVNPHLENIPRVVMNIILTCQNSNTPLYHKMIDYSHEGTTLNDRSDRIVIYTDEKNLNFIRDAVLNLSLKNPDWFEGREVPQLAAKISSGIAIAQSLNENQKKIGQSFSDLRAKFIVNVYQEATRELIFRYGKNLLWKQPDVTIEQAFGEEAMKQTSFKVEELFDTLRTIDPSNILPRNEIEEVCWKVVSRLATKLLSRVKPKILYEIVKLKITELAPAYEIDPNNIAFNKPNSSSRR